MTTIRDLDECRYLMHFQHDDRLIAVGWLGKDAPYPQGDVGEAFLVKLEALCKEPWEPGHFMGWHECEFCPSPFAASSTKRFSWFRKPAPVPQLPHQTSVCNLYIPYKGRVFAAPEGIVHYISFHHYRPPDIFIEAVLACPPMGSEEYLDALRENGGPAVTSSLGPAWTDCEQLLRYLGEHFPFDRESPFTPALIPLDATTPEGNSPLHIAAGWGDRLAVRLLVDAGANVNAVGENGETPLHVAARKAGDLVIRILLQAGAKTLISKLGETPKDILDEFHYRKDFDWNGAP